MPPPFFFKFIFDPHQDQFGWCYRIGVPPGGHSRSAPGLGWVRPLAAILVVVVQFWFGAPPSGHFLFLAQDCPLVAISRHCPVTPSVGSSRGSLPCARGRSCQLSSLARVGVDRCHPGPQCFLFKSSPFGFSLHELLCIFDLWVSSQMTCDCSSGLVFSQDLCVCQLDFSLFSAPACCDMFTVSPLAMCG